MITDQQIARVLAGFNFDKVHQIYELWNWKWSKGEVPSKDDIVDEAFRLLKNAQKSFKKEEISHSCGGLKVEAHFEEGFDEPTVELIFEAYTSIA